MKKTSSKRTSRTSVPRADCHAPNLLPKVLILIGIFLFLVSVFFYFRFPAMGKVIETPPLKAISLDIHEAEEFSVEKVSQFEVQFKASKEKSPGTLVFFLLEKSPGLLQYRLEDKSGVEIARGLLNGDFSSSGLLFTNTDSLPDLELSYDGANLKVINLNYVAPDYSSITLLDANLKPITQEKLLNGKLLFVKKNETVTLYFNVSSTKTPEVTAFWKNGASLSAAEFMVNASAPDSVLMRLQWTPAEEKAFVLNLKAAVDGVVTGKQYLFGVNGVISVLDDAKFTPMVMKKVDESTVNVTFTLQALAEIQPFSLPCGSFNIRAVPDILNVYRYSGGVQQFTEGRPSEFGQLESNKGYAIQLKEGLAPVSFTVSCKASDVFLAPPVPNLVEGWNFVGISGYEPETIETLQDEAAPAGTKITLVKVLNNDNLYFDVEELEPGKAYWVFVG